MLKRLRFNGSFILDYVFFSLGSCLISQIFLDCSTVLLQADYLWHPGKTLMPFKNPQLLFPLDQVGFADSSEIWGTVIWEMENNFLFTGCLHATRISKAYTHSRNHEPAHSSKSIYSERLFFSHRVRRFSVYNDFPLSSILKGELVKWVASTLYSKSSLIPFEAPSNKSMSRLQCVFCSLPAMWMAYANGIGWRSSVL